MPQRRGETASVFVRGLPLESFGGLWIAPLLLGPEIEGVGTNSGPCPGSQEPGGLWWSGILPAKAAQAAARARRGAIGSPGSVSFGT
jgi:hypothetical protein